MNDLPAAKIKMMRGSVHCMTLGLFGLLPLVGVPFALASLWVSYSVRRQEMRFWNPAKTYRILGLVCASLGALVWSIVDTILIYNLCNKYINS